MSDQKKPLADLDPAKLAEAAQTALNCFRRMYDAIESGATAADLADDPSYWPLSILMVALGDDTETETAAGNWRDGRYVGPDAASGL